MSLRLEGSTLVSENGPTYPLKDILSIKFSPNFDGPSRVTFSLKNRSKQRLVYFRFKSLLIALGIGIPLCVLVAKFSITLALSLMLLYSALQLPALRRVYQEISQFGIKTYRIPAIDEFILLEQAVWRAPGGKALIKQDFVLGVTLESLGFVFLPRCIYNSQNLRKYLQFFSSVIYPIVMVIVPFVLSSAVLFGKLTKHFVQALANDFVFQFLYENADDAWDALVLFIQQYPLLDTAYKFVDSWVDWTVLLVDSLWDLLRAEFLIVFMRVEYLSHCYRQVVKQLQSVYSAVGDLLEKVGFQQWARAAAEHAHKNKEKDDTVSYRAGLKTVKAAQKVRKHLSKLSDKPKTPTETVPKEEGKSARFSIKPLR